LLLLYFFPLFAKISLICVKFSIVTMGGFGMVHRLYPLKREVFDRVVLPLIAEHRKKAGRPPSVVHDAFFCGVLYVLRTRCVVARFAEIFWAMAHGFTPATNVGVRVVFSGGYAIICRASKSCV
jgi:hypothetical protein